MNNMTKATGTCMIFTILVSSDRRWLQFQHSVVLWAVLALVRCVCEVLGNHVCMYVWLLLLLSLLLLLLQLDGIAITLIYSNSTYSLVCVCVCTPNMLFSANMYAYVWTTEHEQPVFQRSLNIGSWFLVCFCYYCTSETLKFYFAFVVIKHYVRILEKKGAIYTFCVWCCSAKLG